MVTFQNDLYSVEQEELSGCLVSVKITINPIEVDNTYDQAIKTLRKSISIPGFRKGKVSEDIVKARYSRDLEKNWKDLLVNNALKNSISLTKIYPLHQQGIRKIDIISCEQHESAEIVFEFERYPFIPEITWDSFSCSLNEYREVTNADIAKRLEHLSHYFSTPHSLDKQAEINDFIVLSLKISDNKINERFLFEKKRFNLSDEDMNQKFLEKFLGAKTNDVIEETIEHKDIVSCLKGNMLSFIVDDIVTLDLPTIDDEKAKELKADSLDDLKAKLKIQLETNAQHKLFQENLEALEQALANFIDFELPSSLLNSKITELKQNKLLSMRLVDYLEDQEILDKEDVINKEVLEEARKQIKILFLVRKIFEQEQLSYSKEELNEMIELCSKEKFFHNPSQPPEITQDLLNEVISNAKERLVYQKALAFVKTKAYSKE